MQVQQYRGGEEEVGASGAPILRFGVFELDLKGGQLRKAGVLVKLQPQPFKVLALLASHASEVVTREEIQQQIWGNDTFVDFERGLNFCVRQIRATLGDDAETPRYIETLPRRGYRLIASVDRLSGASPGPVRAEGGKHRRWRGKRRQTVEMAGRFRSQCRPVFLPVGVVRLRKRAFLSSAYQPAPPLTK